jgi:hypothetical protein
MVCLFTVPVYALPHDFDHANARLDRLITLESGVEIILSSQPPQFCKDGRSDFFVSFPNSNTILAGCYSVDDADVVELDFGRRGKALIPLESFKPVRNS